MKNPPTRLAGLLPLGTLAALAACLGAMAAFAGCELAVDFDRSKIDGGAGLLDSSFSDSPAADVAQPDATKPPTDGGVDAATDANAAETSTADTGTPDANGLDANVSDTSVPDANVADTSVPDADIADASGD